MGQRPRSQAHSKGLVEVALLGKYPTPDKPSKKHRPTRTSETHTQYSAWLTQKLNRNSARRVRPCSQPHMSRADGIVFQKNEIDSLQPRMRVDTRPRFWRTQPLPTLVHATNDRTANRLRPTGWRQWTRPTIVQYSLRHATHQQIRRRNSFNTQVSGGRYPCINAMPQYGYIWDAVIAHTNSDIVTAAHRMRKVSF